MTIDDYIALADIPKIQLESEEELPGLRWRNQSPSPCRGQELRTYRSVQQGKYCIWRRVVLILKVFVVQVSARFSLLHRRPKWSKWSLWRFLLIWPHAGQKKTHEGFEELWECSKRKEDNCVCFLFGVCKYVVFFSQSFKTFLKPFNHSCPNPCEGIGMKQICTVQSWSQIRGGEAERGAENAERNVGTPRMD